jgi:hypothetical protein
MDRAMALGEEEDDRGGGPVLGEAEDDSGRGTEADVEEGVCSSRLSNSSKLKVSVYIHIYKYINKYAYLHIKCLCVYVNMLIRL